VNPTWVFMKRLTRVVLVDGKASTEGIRQTLGMFDVRFNLPSLMIGVSYDARDDG
jgi:hypothetical protein